MSIENNIDNWVRVSRVRNNFELPDMELVEVLRMYRNHNRELPVDILVFENKQNKIRRDVHFYNGCLYYSDYYNGLIPCDRTKITYSYPMA